MEPLNNAEGPSPCQDSTLNSATSTANNAGSTIAHRADMRSNRDGQTSLPVVAAIVYQVGPDLKKAVLVVAECPFCTWAHRHECEWPAPSLMKKRARCGGSYDVLPYRATKRGTRKKAA